MDSSFPVNRPRVFNYLTRPLNTLFLVSATRDAFVNYPVNITCTSTGPGAGQTGTVYLRLYDKPTNPHWSWQFELARGTNVNNQTGGDPVTTQKTLTVNLSGMIPAGMYARISTDSNVGSPSFLTRPGHEVLL